MSPLQNLILTAWQRLKPQILGNPADLARRLARRHGKTFSRPPRAWCLAVRACDRRIGVRNGLIDPEYATDPHDPAHPGRVVQHTVTLTPDLLRQLCCPVRLHPPGELWNDAARKLGTTRQGLTPKRISGTLGTRHIKGLLGRPGRPVPLVFSHDMLDPANARDSAMPHPLWTGNESVSARIPNYLEQTILRIPVYAPTTDRHFCNEHVHPEVAGPPPQHPRLQPPEPDYVWYKWSTAGEYLGDDPRYWRKRPSDPGSPPPPGATKPKRKRPPKPSRASGSLVFRGWRWVCPRCGRKVRTLYLPVPPAELLKDESLRKDEGKRQKDEIAQQATNNYQLTTNQIFACWSCHHLSGFSAIAANSWNDLVSYFSGGLLYGHEVPEPPGYRESARRKNRYTPQINRPSPRREQLLELLLAGLPAKQIAARMRLKLGDVHTRISLMLKSENVRNRALLASKFGRDPTTQPGRLHRTQQRRAEVLELLLQNLPAAQIARRLGVKPKLIWQDTYFLCQKHGVKGRAGLTPLLSLVHGGEAG